MIESIIQNTKYIVIIIGNYGARYYRFYLNDTKALIISNIEKIFIYKYYNYEFWDFPMKFSYIQSQTRQLKLCWGLLLGEGAHD